MCLVISQNIGSKYHNSFNIPFFPEYFVTHCSILIRDPCLHLQSMGSHRDLMAICSLPQSENEAWNSNEKFSLRRQKKGNGKKSTNPLHEEGGKTYRQQQDSNLRGHSPWDFESHALTARPCCQSFLWKFWKTIWLKRENFSQIPKIAFFTSKTPWKRPETISGSYNWPRRRCWYSCIYRWIDEVVKKTRGSSSKKSTRILFQSAIPLLV